MCKHWWLSSKLTEEEENNVTLMLIDGMILSTSLLWMVMYVQLYSYRHMNYCLQQVIVRLGHHHPEFSRLSMANLYYLFNGIKHCPTLVSKLKAARRNRLFVERHSATNKRPKIQSNEWWFHCQRTSLKEDSVLYQITITTYHHVRNIHKHKPWNNGCLYVSRNLRHGVFGRLLDNWYVFIMRCVGLYYMKKLSRLDTAISIHLFNRTNRPQAG